MEKKISFNIKKTQTISALNELIKATGENQTTILNKILDEHFNGQKSGVDVYGPIKDNIRKLSLLLLSAELNVQAVRREVEVLVWLTSQF